MELTNLKLAPTKPGKRFVHAYLQTTNTFYKIAGKLKCLSIFLIKSTRKIPPCNKVCVADAIKNTAAMTIIKEKKNFALFWKSNLLITKKRLGAFQNKPLKTMVIN